MIETCECCSTRKDRSICLSSPIGTLQSQSRQGIAAPHSVAISLVLLLFCSFASVWLDMRWLLVEAAHSLEPFVYIGRGSGWSWSCLLLGPWPGLPGAALRDQMALSRQSDYLFCRLRYLQMVSFRSSNLRNSEQGAEHRSRNHSRSWLLQMAYATCWMRCY